MKGPDPAAARSAYSRLAAAYDDRLSLRVVRGIQLRAVERLCLRPGDRVLDVACGTGVNFSAIQAKIGPEGRILGVDLSEEMLAVADRRVREHGWSNVDLIESAVEVAELPAGLDAALFSFTHDVVRSAPAVTRVIKSLHAGAAVAACGVKWAPRWNLPVNAAVGLATRRYITTFEGLGEPWSELAARLVDARVDEAWLGAIYVFDARAGVICGS